jgi:hypothetical protein
VNFKRRIRTIFSAGAFVAAAFLLSGCVESAGSILPDSQTVFGPRLKLQFYKLRKGFGQEPVQAGFTWNGGLYANAGRTLHEVGAFSVHPFEGGDYIIQVVPERQARVTQFALLHRLADGVYETFPIDEADADEPTRAAYCGKGDNNNPRACRIETRDQLFAFARATAVRHTDDGVLVIRLPDGADRPQRQQRPVRRGPPPRR